MKNKYYILIDKEGRSGLFYSYSKSKTHPGYYFCKEVVVKFFKSWQKRDPSWHRFYTKIDNIAEIKEITDIKDFQPYFERNMEIDYKAYVDYVKHITSSAPDCLLSPDYVKVAAVGDKK